VQWHQRVSSTRPHGSQLNKLFMAKIETPSDRQGGTLKPLAVGVSLWDTSPATSAARELIWLAPALLGLEVRRHLEVRPTVDASPSLRGTAVIERPTTPRAPHHGYPLSGERPVGQDHAPGAFLLYSVCSGCRGHIHQGEGRPHKLAFEHLIS